MNAPLILHAKTSDRFFLCPSLVTSTFYLLLQEKAAMEDVLKIGISQQSDAYYRA
jgi:hypothetical protein